MQLLNNVFRDGGRPRRSRGVEEGKEEVGPCVLLPLRSHPFYTDGKGKDIKGSVACISIATLILGGPNELAKWSVATSQATTAERTPRPLLMEAEFSPSAARGLLATVTVWRSISPCRGQEPLIFNTFLSQILRLLAFPDVSNGFGASFEQGPRRGSFRDFSLFLDSLIIHVG